jgi:hypothetical protein
MTNATEPTMTQELSNAAWSRIGVFYRRTWKMEMPVSAPDGLWIVVTIAGTIRGQLHKVRVAPAPGGMDGQYLVTVHRFDRRPGKLDTAGEILVTTPSSDATLGRDIHEALLAVDVTAINLDDEDGLWEDEE